MRTTLLITVMACLLLTTAQAYAVAEVGTKVVSQRELRSAPPTDEELGFLRAKFGMDADKEFENLEEVRKEMKR